MDFSVAFQVRLLALIYLDKDFYALSKDLLQAEFFNSVFCQWLFNFGNQYYELYRGLPTKIVLDQELLTSSVLPEEESLVGEFFALLIDNNKAELLYVKDTFVKFAKSKSIKLTLSSKDQAIESGDFDDLTSSLKDQAKKFVPANLDRDIELFSLRNLKEIYADQEGIKTDIGLIDDVVKGLQIKQLSVALGDLNVGKSLFLQHIGGKAVRQQRHVLHVTLEMSFARTLARYLANLGDEEDDVSYQQIIQFEPQDKVLHYVHDSLRERYEGYLQIEEFPTGKCKIGDLENLLEKYPDTDLLIVDYLQIMKPEKKREQPRFELTDLAVGLRGIASEYKIHVASAHQASKAASGRRIVDVGKSSEDYGVMRVADFAVGLGQNRDDALKQELILFLARSRNSEKFIAERYKLDFKRMRLRLMRQELLNND